MRTFTSMADFYYRVSKDERYKLVAIEAYKKQVFRDDAIVNYENSVIWMDTWLDEKKRVNYIPYGQKEFNCIDMVNYLNTTANDMVRKWPPIKDLPND